MIRSEPIEGEDKPQGGIAIMTTLRTSVSILAVGILLLTHGMVLAQPSIEKTVVFAAGMDGIALYRIPGVVVTPKKTILAYCEARKDGGSDWGEIEIHMKRSTDSGKTWQPAQRIAKNAPRIEGNPKKKQGGEHEQTMNNPVAIVDQQTGTVEFLYCVNYARCFSIRSIDDGVSWSEPVEITNTFESFRKYYDWKVIATGPGHGIQLNKGRLLVPIWLAYGKTGDHAPSASATMYSDDHGKTWNAGDIAVPNTSEYGNPNESTLAQLADDRVILVSRNESNANRKLVSFSKDGATGWSVPVFHNDLWEPICMASLLACKSNPNSLLFSGVRNLARDQDGTEIPRGRGRRENVSIQWSPDNGQSWPSVQTLDAGPSAYSDLAELGNGIYGSLYEGDKEILFAKFDLTGLSTKP